MAIEPKPDHGKAIADEHPFAHLRATAEELERLRAMAPPPRSLEEWLGPPHEASEEELSELKWFLQEREALRQADIERLEERLTDLDR
jgi:hypothetical protein